MANVISIHSPFSPSFSVKHIEQRVVLNFVSFQANSNKFYIMEFQKAEESSDYAYRIYTEYGRMGRSPRQEGRHFMDRSLALKEFEKILSSKHGKGYELISTKMKLDEFFMPIYDSEKKIIKGTDVSGSPTLSIHTELGELSEIQLGRGLQVLHEIEENLHKGNADCTRLSNKFYSLIPMTFGNQIDEERWILDTDEKLNEKKEWLIMMMAELEDSSNY